MKKYNYQTLEKALFEATKRCSIQQGLALLEKAENVVLKNQNPINLENELFVIISKNQKTFDSDRLAA